MTGWSSTTLTLCVLSLVFVFSLVPPSSCAPKFQRRNWSPQAMMYLKGTQGRRLVSEEPKEGGFYHTLHLETRSQNTEKLSDDRAATVLLNFLQQARDGDDELDFQDEDLPVWKRHFF